MPGKKGKEGMDRKEILTTISIGIQYTMPIRLMTFLHRNIKNE